MNPGVLAANAIAVAGVISSAIASLPAAAFTVSNPSYVDWQQFARTAKTGGWAGKGTTTIPAWPISVSTPGAIYARLVAKGDPGRTDGTVIQSAWLLNATVPTSATSIDVTGVGCGSAWFQVQLSGSATGPWQSAPTPVKLGVGVAVFGTGQSLIERMIGAVPAATTGTTLADVGVALNGYVSYIATYNDGSGSGARAVATPTWGPPVQTGAFDGAGFAQIADQMQQSLGCNIIIASHSYGGVGAADLTKNSDLSNGTQFSSITAIMNIVKAWEYCWWFQGHTNSLQGTAARDYKCFLTWFFGYAAFKNFWGNQVRGLVMGIPPTTAWGTTAQMNEIRAAQYRWAKNEGALSCANGCYYANTYSLSETDGTHPNQTGSKQLANLVLTAFVNGADTPAGDNTLTPATPAAAGAAQGSTPTYTAAGKYLAAGLNGGSLVITPPPIGPQCFAAWVAKPSGAGVLFAGTGWYLQGDGSGKIQINSGGVNHLQTSAGGYDSTFHRIDVEADPTPFDQTAVSTITVKIDGVPVPGLIAIPGPSGTGNTTIRTFTGFDLPYDPSTVSGLDIYNKLGMSVPTGATAGTEAFLYTALPLNGNSAALL